MNELIECYLAGPRELRDAIAGMSAAEIDAAPVPGKWSTRQVICHVADFEPVYADRMKRVIALENPELLDLPEKPLADRLGYDVRDIEEELQLIECVRRHMGRILRNCQPRDFQRQGLHSTLGPLPLEVLLKKAISHIPHHTPFIAEKRRALAKQG